jgi:ATP phosphoribosyltransferase regulatory subunit
MTIDRLPAGARDLLPLEVAQKSWINDRLQQVFYQWGYQRIVTSTLEWLDTLTAGGAIQPSTVIQIRYDSEKTLGLRPELTASIARAAVTRMAGNTYPQRLCYRANVFRNPTHNHHGRQVEFYQAGVELLFAEGILADTEIILLAADCLEALGISDNWHILLGEAGLTTALLEVFPEALRQQIRYCLANLDAISLEAMPLEPELKAKARLLFDLRGKPEEVLAKVTTFDLDGSAQIKVNNLKSLIDLLNRSSAKPLPLALDLSLLQTFDYYTGIVFKIVSFQDNQFHLLSKGGRYDRLLGLYAPQNNAASGVGFSFNIEDLHSCLLNTGKLPQQTPPTNCLVVPQTPEAATAAFQYAKQLRASKSDIKVEIDLGSRNPAQIREYALNCRIERLVWISIDGTPTVESL